MSESKKILVAGSGAIGSVFACLLAEAGHRVTALARGPQLAAMRASGISVSGIWGRHRSCDVAAAGSAEELESAYDAILVCCKSFQTGQLLADIGDRLASGGRAVSLQNGLGNIECLEALFGRERCLAGRVIFGALLERPAQVRVTVEADAVLIGPAAGGADTYAELWARIFDQAGIHCRADASVMSAIWGKVFYNAALNPMGALLGLSYGELAADRDRRSVMDRVIEEAFAVARAEGVPMPWIDAAAYRRMFYEKLLPATVDHRSSMLQDIESGRPTEIDAICGEIVRRGERAGLPVDSNRLLTVLVKARSGQPPSR